jgi:hypothetical protein
MSVGYRGPKLSLRRKPVWHGRIAHGARAAAGLLGVQP